MPGGLVALAMLSLVSSAVANPLDSAASTKATKRASQQNAQSQLPLSYDHRRLGAQLDYRDFLKSPPEPRGPTETAIGRSTLRFDVTRNYDDLATQVDDINASPDAPNFRRLVRSRSKSSSMRVPYLGLTVTNPLAQLEDPLLPK
jgi:hypothetical protein